MVNKKNPPVLFESPPSTERRFLNASGEIVKGKKAQVKIQQMAFMLLAITLFFVLVAMLVLVFKFS